MNLSFSYQNLDNQKFGICLKENFNFLNKEQIKQIGKLFLNELLIICPNQFLNARKFASICYSWGKPEIFNPLDHYESNSKNKKKIEKLGVSKIPGLVKVCAKKDQDGDLIGILGDDEIKWHTDGSGKINPPECIALYAIEVGLNNHIDFLECVTPYQKLTNEDKKVVDDLKYIHFYDLNSAPKFNEKFIESIETQLKIIFNNEISYKQIQIPLINISPNGYRGFRYNCTSFIKFVDKTEKENKELKEWIESLLFKEENVYTHQFKKGDLLFMDQTVMLHRRRPQDFSNRLLYRMQFDVSKLI